MEPLGDWGTIAPWKSRHVLLIGVAGGSPTSALSLGEKRAMMKTPPGLLIAVWSGQWSTTARTVGVGDLSLIDAALK